MIQARLPGTASEHDEQAALFRLIDTYAAQYPALLNVAAVPNGGHRRPAVAARLKAEGVKRGVPDCGIFIARQGYHGLFIEMKTAIGVVKPEQKVWHERLRAEGYRVEVCRGWVAAWNVICEYLGLPEELSC